MNNPQTKIEKIAQHYGYSNANALANGLGLAPMKTDYGFGKKGARAEKEDAAQLLQAFIQAGYTEEESTEQNFTLKTGGYGYTPRAGEQRKRYNPDGALGYGEDEGDEVFCGRHR